MVTAFTNQIHGCDILTTNENYWTKWREPMNYCFFSVKDVRLNYLKLI